MPFDGAPLPCPDDSETVQILIRARELIQRGWCRGVPARTFFLREAHPAHSRAQSWCMVGAIDRAWHERHGGRGHSKAQDLIADVLGVEDIMKWNDERWREKATVIWALEEAIKLGRQRDMLQALSSPAHEPLERTAEMRFLGVTAADGMSLDIPAQHRQLVYETQ